jgi:hypothetical protein
MNPSLRLLPVLMEFFPSAALLKSVEGQSAMRAFVVGIGFPSLAL